MYQAEHLDLITNVRDQFTSDLTRLSGLLETAGQQADSLSPILINVVVRDRPLQKLQNRLARVQGMEISGLATGSFGSSQSGISAADLLEQHSHTLSQTLSDTFEDNLSDIQSAVEGVVDEDDVPRSIANVNHLAVANANLVTVPGGTGSTASMPGDLADSLSNAVQQAVTDGGRQPAGGMSQRLLRRQEIGRVEDLFGMTLPTSAFAHRDASPANLLRGDTPLTGVTPGDVADHVSPQAMMRAFDFEGLQARMPPGLKQLGTRRGMAGAPLAAIAKHAQGIENVDDLLSQMVSNQRLEWEQLKESFFDIRIGMTQFYDFFAALMPLMFVFMGSLPAVIAGLGGLATAAVGAATALGSIAGLGLLGQAGLQADGTPGMDEITDVFDGLADDFYESFRGVAERLAPVFEDGLDGLSRLFDELSRRAELLPQLTDDARNFGDWFIDFAAGTFEELILLSDAASETFSLLAAGLESRDILRGFAGGLAIVLPRLAQLSNIILDALPGITRFSGGMLTMSTYILGTLSAVTSFSTALIQLVPGINDGNRALGVLVGTFFTLMSATFLVTKVSAIFQSRLMELVMNKMLAVNWSSLLTASYYKQATGASIASKATWGLTAAVAALKKVVAGFLAMTGIGLLLVGVGSAVSHLTGEFTDLDSSITDATDSLREFQRQEQSMRGRGDAFMGNLDDQTEVYVDVTDNSEVNIDGGGSDIYQDVESSSFINSDRFFDDF